MKTKEGQPFNHLEFDHDLKTLVNDFDRVEPIITSVQDKINITLKIWPKPTIRTITWVGNENIATKKLQGELGVPLSSVFDRQTFNRSFHKLKAYYVKKGYFEAQLDYKVTHDPLTEEVDILITITEGRSGKIKDICFVNFTPEEEDEVLDLILTKKYNFIFSILSNSGFYNEEMIQRDQFVILNYLQNEGLADAKVEISVNEIAPSTTFEMRERDKIMVTIYAEKGPQFHFGKINFKGNTLFDDDTIRNMLLMSEGDVYSPETIRETIENIRDLMAAKDISMPILTMKSV